MLTKNEKIKFVEEGRSILQKYSVIGVVPLANVPDRLVQSNRNKQRASVHFILGRKTLLTKILEGSEKTKPLVKELTGTSAIVLSNDDPFDVFQRFKSNYIKMAAKPNQIAPEDIEIQAGDTTIQPGQAVTELKQAGIDVQIKAGKVVIAKDKTIVKKGTNITAQVAKALKTLDIMPFSASLLPAVLLSGNMVFTKDILNIDPARTVSEIGHGFMQAFTLSMETGNVNSYNIIQFVQKAFRSARMLGIEARLYEPGVIDTLIQNAVAQASALNASVPQAQDQK
jgi:large subunit ribosomal protein L10